MMNGAKSQTPSSKSQANFKPQGSENCLFVLEFCNWNLFGAWVLGFGVSSA